MLQRGPERQDTMVNQEPGRHNFLLCSCADSGMLTS